MNRIALVVNPRARPATHAELLHRFTQQAPGLVVHWTTVDEPGTTQARRAAAEGVNLVVAAGGDGTVRAVATGLAGTGVPLAVIGLGTANVLAGNLRLPRGIRRQVDVALSGIDRRIDLGWARFRFDDDPVWTPETGFVLMAGMGHDAAAVAATDAGTKRRLGWISYLWRAGRLLSRSPMTMRLTVDGRRSTTAAWSVLVGNFPGIPGGVQVFAGAHPDDGELDLLEARIRHPVQWIPVALSGWGHRPVIGSGLVRSRAREVMVEPEHPTPVQLDGDSVAPVRAARFRVAPGALLLRVPRWRGRLVGPLTEGEDREGAWTSH